MVTEENVSGESMMKDFIHNFLGYFIQTFKNIAKNQSILTTLILSVFFYSFFYPTAYQGQHAESLPIIIVDEEQSQLSNAIITQVSKNPDIDIRYIVPNFSQAQQLLQTQHADGILLLPEHLTESVRRGETGGIGIYLSTAYFLKTKQIGLGIATSIESVLMDYAEKFGQTSAFQPALPIHQIPLFNTLSGYGSYIFPAVAPIIIHQTVFLGLCMLIAGYREKSSMSQAWQPTKTEFCAIFAAILSIGCLGCFYLFGFTFWFYDYPRGGNFAAMLLAVPIFVSAVIAMAMFFASFLDSSERAGHVIVVSSIPLFLLTGLAYPHHAMPQWIQQLAWILPSTHGAQMFVQLNQMGASLYDVLPKLIYLATCAGVFSLLGYYRLTTTRTKTSS